MNAIGAELELIASAAIMGDSNKTVNGVRSSAAIEMQRPLYNKKAKIRKSGVIFSDHGRRWSGTAGL